ncbi:MAG TPA: response regulator [Chitinophaga sp.]|uniref:response regulator n=1 Tax=Chitinophaga sp. TaxID=1869181 RepID=UPI002DBD0178|nr:response regulator [Chitinophaga sp.]HEU4551929.1 response regulator [Chitinophaga sp.]
MAEREKYILLADDDLEDQEILTEAILAHDDQLVIKTVINGPQLIRHLEACAPQELPGLVILDYKMPFLTAAEVLDNIGHDPHYATIPKVVWSTSRQPEHMKECLEKGAMAYFIKPSGQQELKELVNKLIAIKNNQAG